MIPGVAFYILIITLLRGSSALKCYCQSNSNGCVAGQCAGAWCVGVISDDPTTGTHKMDKMCAPNNPANSATDACVKDTQGQVTTQTCVCQSEDFCNSDAGMSRMINDKSILLASGAATQQSISGNQPNPQLPPFFNSNNAIPPQNPDQLPPGLILAGSPPQNTPAANGGPPPGVFGRQPVQAVPSSGAAPDPAQNVAGTNNNNSIPTLPRTPLFPAIGQDPGGIGAGVPNVGSQISSNLGGGPPPNLGGGGVPLPNNNLNGLISDSLETTQKINNETTSTVAAMIHKMGQKENGGDKRGHSNEMKYTCICDGPAYCQNGKCRDDYCSMIEIDMRDLSHSVPPSLAKSPPTTENHSQSMMIHKGCSSAALLPSGVVPRKLYGKMPYEMVLNGKQVKITANQQFCTGDECNGSSLIMASIWLLVLSAIISFLSV